MSSMFVKYVPLRHIFRIGKSPKSLGARSGECDGWVMTGMFFSARNCCAISDVWLGALSWYSNYCLCHFSHRFLQTASRILCITCAYKRPVTFCPGGTNSWCTKPSKNSGNFFIALEYKCTWRIHMKQGKCTHSELHSSNGSWWGKWRPGEFHEVTTRQTLDLTFKAAAQTWSIAS
jgi:hypothetical protein